MNLNAFLSHTKKNNIHNDSYKIKIIIIIYLKIFDINKVVLTKMYFELDF